MPTLHDVFAVESLLPRVGGGEMAKKNRKEPGRWREERELIAKRASAELMLKGRRGEEEGDSEAKELTSRGGGG